MGLRYRAVGWNRQKRVYDLSLLSALVLYIGVFLGVGSMLKANATLETLLIRAFGTAAFLLLHVILSIGPLCRLDARFLPLLYNRRHLGVTLFFAAMAHAVLSVVQFHLFGDAHPLVSVLAGNAHYGSVADFPFQSLGFLALVILFLMAATSHDFWLHNLTAPTWKALHMLVYVAYGLLVLHVALGALQSERHPLYALAVAAGAAWVLALHLVAARREAAFDRREPGPVKDDGFVDVCALADIPEARAHVTCLSGERVAIFRYNGRLAAVSNVCQHQNGPLGEGRVIDGCITCPWHGYQYVPETGESPPPFTEKVATFSVRVEAGRVLVDPTAHTAGDPAGSFVLEQDA